jgi:flavin-dependent dehydrogenase
VRADAVVVGAGPAGATAALLLARAGLDVMLLDRQAFPRPKPCGDCLSAEAGRLLERLGLRAAVEAAAPARLAGWRIVGPSGAAFSARFAELVPAGDAAAAALALPRARLDAALLAAARAAGAQVRTGVRVDDLLAGGGVRGTARDGTTVEVRARLVIGADGLRSRIARRTGASRAPGPLRKVSLTVHVTGVAGIADLGEMHLAPGLCVGLAPVGRGACNLTVVALAALHGRALAGDAWRFLVAAVDRLPALAGRFNEAFIEGGPPLQAAGRGTRPPAPPLASGPFDRPTGPAVTDGVALVGDAAGYFDPFTGQGIYQAMAGAAMLAADALPALRRAGGPVPARALRRYALGRARMVGGARAVQRVIEAVLSRPALADAAIDRLARAPAAARRLLAVTGDLDRPSSLLSPGPILSFAFPCRRRPTG